MSILQVLLLAGGLGLDAMSVCMGIGILWHGPRQRFRLAWHMGLFQFFMPILGWFAGENMANLLRSVGSYVAALLLFALGAKMLYEALRAHPGAAAQQAEEAVERHTKSKDPTRGWSLLMLSVVTSLDALVAGFSLGVSGHGAYILQTSVVIGVVAAAMALTGVLIGKRIGVMLGKPAEILGALVLMGLGISFLFVRA